MSNDPQITERIDAGLKESGKASTDPISQYVESRRPYFERTYPGAVDVVLASEERGLREANERGDLEGWSGEGDPLAHVAKRVQARFQQADGSFQTPLDTSSFSAELRSVLETSQKKGSNIVMVWMNQGGTVTRSLDSEIHHEILSPGQGGCAQVVIASNDSKDVCTSLLHYAPTAQSKLLEDLEKRALIHQNRRVDVAIMVMPGDDVSLIVIALHRLLPEARIQVFELDLATSSQNSDDDVLRCQLEGDGTVSITLKGLSGSLLRKSEPALK